MHHINTPKTAADAIEIQNRLKTDIDLRDIEKPINIIAGIDVGYDYHRQLSKGAMVIMRYPSLELISSAVAYDPTPFPYIPGLLSFREAPVILKLLSLLKEMPDLLMIDGQGIAHPRRIGIASHIGVLANLPTIGVAKKRLCGHYTEPLQQKYATTPLIDRNEQIGTVLRSRENVKPLFVSPGHHISHTKAVDIVCRCLGQYRLPEPTRLADKLSKI